jgi:anti-anti-sigma factor
MSYTLLEITRLVVHDTIEMELRGELDLSSAGQLEAELEKIHRQAKRVIIDLSQLEFIDSSGVRTLLKAASDAKLNGHTVVLLRARPEVQRIFEVAGLENNLPFAD